MNEPQTLIKLQGLKKSYGNKLVLKNINLDFYKGEFAVIVGRSGCGKTTLLRLIAGIDHLEAGEIHFTQQKSFQSVRVMFQEHRLLPWARVLANVRLGFGPLRNTHEAQENAQKTLNHVGIGDRANDWPRVLSGGQKQRAALARALVSNPQILALDEPLGALDALTRIEMQDLLEEVWLKNGLTAILVTHDVSEAVRLADRIVVLEKGEVSQVIPVDLPRPRKQSDPRFAQIEGLLLDYLLRKS
jgi:sulfonate transport system ATP-binding protein